MSPVRSLFGSSSSGVREVLQCFVELGSDARVAQMPRSQSAHVPGNWIERDRRQYNTIGISGDDSPRGRAKLLALWYGLRAERIVCNPRVVVTGHPIGSLLLVYAMVFWDPLPARGMTRPDKWHTTLVRYSCPVGHGDNIRTLQNTLDGLLAVLLGPHEEHVLQLGEPPWGSWAFGLDGKSKSLCEVLRSATVHIVQHRLHIPVGEQRLLHVSWQ